MLTSAGPQPLSVPAMPSRRLSTGCTSPKWPNSSCTSTYSSGVRECFSSSRNTPAHTRTGVFGMVLKWRVPGSSASYRSKGQPAATETTALSASCPRTGESTSSIRCGFTATMTTSAASATSRASRQGRMPRGCVAAHSLSQSFAQAQICSGSSAFERSSPSAMACAILPNPINPSFISFLSILGLPHFPIFSEQPGPQLGRPSNGSSGLGSGPLPAKWRRAIRSATPPSITSCTSWARTAA